MGRVADFTYFDFQVLVRDIDPNAHMANHVYVAYLSEARARLLRALDPGRRHFLPSVVADVHVRYRDALQPMERFRVGVAVTKVGTSSITFAYRFEGADGRLAAEAESVEVAVDAVTRRPRPIAPEGRRLLGATSDSK